MTDQPKPTQPKQAKAEQAKPEQIKAESQQPTRRRKVSGGSSLRRPERAEGTPAGKITRTPKSKPAAHDASLAVTDKKLAGKKAAAPPPAQKSAAQKPAAQKAAGFTAGRWRHVRSRTGAMVALVAGLVACGVGALLLFGPAARQPANEAFVDTAATTEAIATVKKAAADIYTIDFSDIEAWKQRTARWLTPGMQAEQNKLAEASAQITAAGGKTTVTAKTDQVGVISVAATHAVLLLNVQQIVGLNGQPGETLQSPVEFTMDKFGDTWKVSLVKPR